MISYELTKSFKYVTFLDGNKEPINGITSKPIIYSDYINHELTSMLFAKNYSDAKIAISQMIYDGLSDDEVTALASVGCFQMSVRDIQEKYEFNSMLDTVEVTAILVPQAKTGSLNPCHFLYFSNNKEFRIDESGSLIDFSNLSSINANKLLLITKSSSPVKYLSQEIHNNMLMPHNNMDKYVLFSSDLSEYMSLDVINVDLMFDRQSLVKLANILVPFDSTGDSIYAQGIHDELNNKYIFALDQVPHNV